MLVFNVSDYWIPAAIALLTIPLHSIVSKDFVPSIIIDLVTIAGCVYNVKPQTYTILLDDYSQREPMDKFLEQYDVPCDTAWISVVERTGSEGVNRPLESIK